MLGTGFIAAGNKWLLLTLLLRAESPTVVGGCFWFTVLVSL